MTIINYIEINGNKLILKSFKKNFSEELKKYAIYNEFYMNDNLDETDEKITIINNIFNIHNVGSIIDNYMNKYYINYRIYNYKNNDLITWLFNKSKIIKDINFKFSWESHYKKSQLYNIKNGNIIISKKLKNDNINQ